MAHLPPIVADLAMILLVAGITTILFKKLNQPLVPVSYTHLYAQRSKRQGFIRKSSARTALLNIYI